MQRGEPVADAASDERVARAVYDALFGLGGLGALLADPGVENVNINGADTVFVTYADGTRERGEPVADSDAELVDLIRMFAARAGHHERRFDRAHPVLHAQLPDGSRLFAVMDVSRRPSVSIRRHRYPKVTLSELVGIGMLDGDLATLLAAAVRARRNILIAGGTNAGKTTLLRGLASVIPASERIVTIEDSYELGLDRDADRHPDVVALQAREANIEGHGEITQSQLVREALRMTPDRVIVGEIRGPEVIPMCNAMSQGNDGSMATIHASTSGQVFHRLASYAIQADERLPVEATNLLVAGAVHLVVHITALPDEASELGDPAHRDEGYDHDQFDDLYRFDDSDRAHPVGEPTSPVAPMKVRRMVSSVREVVGADGAQVITNEIYRPGPDGRAVPAAPLRPDTMNALIAAGYRPRTHTAGR
jgi:Flp pilus assembly CpaF family ATPase